ncbi:hypothetical protein [Streptomyces sp. t39]|uniref:hypothetical protein n=1 Tax=Streptomyces sp. t39 TaxID=1828156 RepID=UPI0011CEAFAB|nr:hypothetical protein [Streptomyces sp. t39]TXS50127.1 hypothetical protein EAO77_27850 [Streptomyces sp. t39]
MTGPEHYRKAERLLCDEYRTDRSVAEAQVHAMLALAAATAGASTRSGSTSADDRAWQEAAVTPDAPTDPLGSIW